MVEVANADDVEKVKEIFQARIDYMVVAHHDFGVRLPLLHGLGIPGAAGAVAVAHHIGPSTPA